jgi:hypothetical protein
LYEKAKRRQVVLGRIVGQMTKLLLKRTFVTGFEGFVAYPADKSRTILAQNLSPL